MLHFKANLALILMSIAGCAIVALLLSHHAGNSARSHSARSDRSPHGYAVEVSPVTVSNGNGNYPDLEFVVLDSSDAIVYRRLGIVMPPLPDPDEILRDARWTERGELILVNIGGVISTMFKLDEQWQLQYSSVLRRQRALPASGPALPQPPALGYDTDAHGNASIGRERNGR